MAISSKLREFLNKSSTQNLLNENDLDKFLNISFTELETTDYKKLIELLLYRYDNLFDELNKLNAGMFADITFTTAITLNPTISIIPSQCFENSTIGSISALGVETISSKAFYNCAKLTNIDLGEICAIGSSAFSGCTALTHVDIPNSICIIGSKAFANCPNLKTINYLGTKEECRKVFWAATWDGTFDSSAIKIVCIDGEM